MNMAKRRGKLLLAIIIAFIASITLGILSFGGSATTTTYADTTLSGEGTVASPYLIGTKADLQQFGDIINGNKGQTRNSNACAKLTADIDLDGGVVYLATWYSYKGTFDGNGYAISNLSRLDAVSNFTNGCVGLFDAIDGATIKNLTVRGTITSSTCPVGGIVGRGTGTFVIKNCVNEVNVTAKGGAAGVIYNVYNSSGALIEDCVNKGTVRSNGTVAGGIIGYANYNATSLTVRKCYNSGTVSAGNVNVGGIVGVCYFWDTNIITDCYNTGAVTASNYVGGIVGAKNGSDSNSYIRNCHNRGTVTMTDTPDTRYIGGISGFGIIALENCYYLSGCVSNGTDGATALSAAQMKVKSNFANWDFEKVWDIESNYPILRPSPVEVEFDQNVLLNGETSTTTVSNLNGETAASLLTEEELGRYSGGESVNIYLEVNNESSSTSIPAEDKSAAKAAVETSGAKEGAYLDLKLYKQLSNDAERTAISESATAFDITVDIPSDITTVPYGYTRTYSIIRVHNGVAETLPSTVSDGKISFSTDKFSTYLIAYSDEFDEDGEYIEFTMDIEDPVIRYVDANNLANEEKVTVRYKITRNAGFNALELVPKYDKNVFKLESVSVNEEALGVSTETLGDGTMKIILENTGDKYTALDGEEEFFLTVTYSIKAAVNGEYEFSLVLAGEENEASVAYYIDTVNGQHGEHVPVAIKVVVPEPLTIVSKQETVIEIGNNQENNKDEQDRLYDYWFTYGKTAVSVEKVEELPAYNELVNNFKVFYTYNGDAEVSYVWYKVNSNGTLTKVFEGREYKVSESVAPITKGEYVVEISAPATDKYYAAETKYGFVYIDVKNISITVENKTSEYGDAIAELTYTGDKPFAGDNFQIVLSTEATSSSPVGTYDIIGTTDSEHALENAEKYNIVITNGTYTITKKALTVTALPQNAKYTGAEPEVSQSAYQVSIEGVTISGVTIAKEAGVDVGNYTLTIAYENSNYDVTLVNGTFTIVSTGADVDEIKALFEALQKVYNGEEQNLLGVSELPDYITEYTALNNVRKPVGEYDGISVTVTVDKNHNVGENDQKTYVFVVDGAKITPAPITIKADDKGHVYGDQPKDLTYTVTSGEIYAGDEINEEYAVYDGETKVSALAFDMNVGEYEIRLSAENSNYEITVVNGTYTVSKADITDSDSDGIPDDADDPEENPSTGLKITVSANNNYYNRELSNSVTVMVGGVVLDSSKYTLTVTKDNTVVDADSVLDAGVYTLTVTVGDSDNYVGASKSATFEILKVKLAGAEFTYESGKASWAAITNDAGKTAEETGVEAKAILEGTTVTYKVYDNDTLIGTFNSREFDALAATTYKVVAEADNDNYLASETTMISAYSVEFTEGDHDLTEAHPTNMPETVYIFEGQNFTISSIKPVLEGYFFDNWNDGNEDYAVGSIYTVNGNSILVAIWDVKGYVITLKYVETSETENTDMFTFNLNLNDAISYSVEVVDPKKDSGTEGVYYTFISKWSDGETEYEITIVDGVATIEGISVTQDMTFVALYEAHYNTYTITYYFSDEGTNAYVQIGDAQQVTYDDIIAYRTYEGADYAWFIKDYWYFNEARTDAVPVRMPATNISVYGSYKFNIGQGDVNASGEVTADDITLYRQWIVGGYTMTVVEKGTEWALVTGGDYDVNTSYFLKRVADNNADESKDIRDVSITRMAIVGGYDWDISTGDTVTGQNIGRTKTVTTIENVTNGLNTLGRVRIYSNLTDTTADVNITVTGNIFVDLGGKTITVKSFVLNTTGKNATITVKNGTIKTIDGITITAPNGNVVLEDLIGFVGESEVNLQAADSSLHFAGVVKFFESENTPASVVVADGTHVVIEEKASLIVKDIEVESGAISLTNNSAVTEIITVKGNFTENSMVDGKVIAEGDETAELRTALSKDGEYTLTRDYDLVKPLVSSANVTLNLNGFKIYNTADIWADGNWSLISVKSGTLTINGEGSLLAKANDCFAVDVQNGANVVINGGTYVGNVHSVYVYAGTLTVNGGTFSVQQKYSQARPDDYVLNCYDSAYIVGKASIFVKGGNFVGFNPENCYAEGAKTNFVAEGYAVVADGNNYSVVKGVASIDDTAYATLQEAIANDGTIKLLNDITLTGEIVVSKTVTIDLNGHTITSAANAAAFKVMGGTLNLIGEGTVTGNNSVYKTIYFMGSTNQSDVNYSVLNVGSDVSVESVNGYAIMVSANNKKSYGVVANIAGKVNGYYGALYTNGSIAQYAGDVVNNEAIESIATFNVGSTAVLSSEDSECAAVYAAGFAKWDIASGASITGASAIYIKSGYLTVSNGAVLKANMATYAEYVNNGNGANVTGDGITIDNTYYPGGNPVVNLGSDLEDTITVTATGASKVATYWYVKTEAELMEAVAAGGYVTIGADINLTEQVVVDKNVTLNLNGKTIGNTTDIWKDTENVATWSLISVQGGCLTIIGNGKLQAKENDCFALDVRNGAELIIEDGTFVGNISAVYVYEGELTVNGGNFSIKQKSSGEGEDKNRFLLNCLDVNYREGTSVISVCGGTFEGFNPAANKAEGNGTNFVVDGYEATNNDGIYTVIKA